MSHTYKDKEGGEWTIVLYGGRVTYHEQHIFGVFGSHATHFEHGETGLHEKDAKAGKNKPSTVDGKLKVLYGGFGTGLPGQRGQHCE